MATRHGPRARFAAGVALVALWLALGLAACTVPGTLQPDATAPPAATATAPPSPVAAVATSKTALGAGTAPLVTNTPPLPTVAVTATPTPTAAPTATPVASPTAATPARGTPGAAASPTRGPFTATPDQPCREVDFDVDKQPLPEQPASVDTVGQAYHCFLLHYVDHKTMDNRVLLNGAWTYLAQAGQGLFTAQDTAPLALTGDDEQDWRVFAQRYTALQQKYRRIDPSLLAHVTIDGLARSLDDNHVAYLEPPQWQTAFAEETGQDILIGPGFTIALDDQSGQFYLYDVYPNSPASAAGLKPGDIVVQVGGQPASRNSGNQDFYNLLTGPVGTTATMQVKRPATGATLNVSVSVAQVKAPLIESRVLPGQIGYIKLRNFSNNAGEEFDKALTALQQQGIKALIFDVRQNPGGSVDALTHIVSHFTHQDPLAISIDDTGKRDPQKFDDKVPLLKLPWVVLADSGSASSSDITAAVAKDRGGYLIGVKTAGALGAAEFYALEDGSALEITVARVLGPDGEEINHVGVPPNEVVTLLPIDLSAGNDPQLQRAVAYLTAR
ncbi:MAG TPA: S41 family peptidase [Thermomicrobiales bacterium]|nr:S41 family peptidase [Thermomicrobiales bacterium]